MKNLLSFSSVLFLSATAVFAQPEQNETAQQSVANQQKSLLEKLDSLNDAVLGLRVNGSVKAGVLTSMAKSDQFSDNSPTQETQAYTTANLVFTARPSSETEARVELRLHKDWQSAYEENNNPVIGHWFSYDGLILNKHVSFNLGYMRVGYTPYTLWTPQPNFLQEPEIFEEERAEAMADRNLDTTNNRLLHGLNVVYNSGNLGVVDNIQAQVTGARLRNIAKKNDQVFFDFDWSDRYVLGARLGAKAFGASVGVNYINVFDRHLSTHALNYVAGDSVTFEENSIISAELGFDSQKLLSELPVKFGVNGEFAYSSWKADMDITENNKTQVYYVASGTVNKPTGESENIVYVQSTEKETPTTRNEDIADENGMGIYIKPVVSASFGDFNAHLKVAYLQNDEDFWSEMASAPAYRGNGVILNANGLYSDSVYSNLISAFGMSSLENLYFQVYNSNPMNATNLLTANTSASENILSSLNKGESQYLYSRLYNNYKNVHMYRNGYNASTIKKLELSELQYLMDGSLDMALPYGIATPDRKGFDVAFDGDWNAAVNLNVRFSQYNQDVVVTKYTQFGVGVGVRLDKVLQEFGVNLDRILVQGSFAHSEEDHYFERKSDRIMAGLSAEIWGPIGIQAGFEQFKMEYGIPLLVTNSSAISKSEEMLLRVGPRIKIAPASYLSVQYGLLTDKVSFIRSDETGVVNDELSIDKNVIMADVTVAF